MRNSEIALFRISPDTKNGAAKPSMKLIHQRSTVQVAISEKATRIVAYHGLLMIIDRGTSLA
jgi:hypothetical protein